MPIGKNALKRVENNGYSRVQSAAPDMQNSEIAQQSVNAHEGGELNATQNGAVKATAKKGGAGSAAASTNKASSAKTRRASSTKSAGAPSRRISTCGHECTCVQIGEDMPVYLL